MKIRPGSISRDTRKPAGPRAEVVGRVTVPPKGGKTPPVLVGRVIPGTKPNKDTGAVVGRVIPGTKPDRDTGAVVGRVIPGKKPNKGSGAVVGRVIPGSKPNKPQKPTAIVVGRIANPAPDRFEGAHTVGRQLPPKK